MSLLSALALAAVLDAALGEPRWLWSRLPHPAVLMGRAVAALDARLNAGPHRRAKGVLALALLLAGAIALGFALAALPGRWAEVIVGAMLLAQRSLSEHVAAVATGLRAGLAEGRAAVALIVSRDTAGMAAPAVARSAIESGAENFSDGVVAPALWFALAGLPGLIAYKVVNTADSMIGYRTPRHEAFGWAAARMDDLLNLAPARLSAVLLRPRLTGWGPLVADARRHRSPNAGWPEAAMARALGVALAGPRSYDGEMRDFPFVNAGGRKEIGAAEVEAAVGRLRLGWGLGMVLVGAAAVAQALL
ncbi:CobD/CbiB family cobalamin biosynthesis protein [Pseudoroseicyclus tamaricis]|uniref:Cobalamin biosynthesis protein CobD n=1 Tax=Pseudoroseicyclus tamaricis TaxID=2705421 RepID=A0A6B2JN56_9RHOB|nr:CobD/CbiB family cobalamin biosynthesis protein [Pseudoroseicyclus tamaricis]NDU99447.1 cobalamin biosynthesis protein [Pseudoroseicyclus tamaricis]